MFLAPNLSGQPIHEEGRLSFWSWVQDSFPLSPLVLLVLWVSPGRLSLCKIVKEVGLGFLQQFLPFLTPTPPSARSLSHSCVSEVIGSSSPPSGNLYFFESELGHPSQWNWWEFLGLIIPPWLKTQVQESGTPSSTYGSMTNFVAQIPFNLRGFFFHP